jgi:hypothetical protein
LVATAVLAVVAATVGAASAFASCNENGSLFWADSNAGFGSTGTKQDLVVRAHSNIGSGCQTNGIVAGGTSHTSPNNGGGALVETGWRDKTDGSGNHYYRPGESFSYASPRVERFRFGPAGSTLFILDYLSDPARSAPSEQSFAAVVRDPKYHNAIGHYDSYGNLFRNMGLMVCVLGMAGTYGVPNGNPASAWQTASSGGC